MPLHTLFIDMNSFFASVEQQERPELRGQPVAVAAIDVDSTSFIAVSYEARALGIRRGMPVGDARTRRSLHIIQARPAVYVQTHHKILKAVGDCLPIHSVDSIDEFTCRLGSNQTDPAIAVALAKKVKQTIYENVGAFLKCSVGLAPNRLLAKVAADMQKPDGLVVLNDGDLPERLYSLELQDLPGIGPRMHARLRAAGVESVEHLFRLTEEQMRRIWGGVVGERWYYWLRGGEPSTPPTKRMTVGHSHVLSPELRTEEAARAVLLRLIQKAAVRLRRINYWARRLEVYISYSFREEGWSGSVALGLCQDTISMIEAFNALWPHRPRQRHPKQVAITLYDLVPHASASMPLFPEETRRLQLSHTIDALNEKMGANALHLGSVHHVLAAAPTRIAFTQIPDFRDD